MGGHQHTYNINNCTNNGNKNMSFLFSLVYVCIKQRKIIIGHGLVVIKLNYLNRIILKYP